MGKKYTLKTGGSLKCPVCGNDTFEEKHFQKEGRDSWVYVCTACTHLVSFKEQLAEKA